MLRGRLRKGKGERLRESERVGERKGRRETDRQTDRDRDRHTRRNKQRDREALSISIVDEIVPFTKRDPYCDCDWGRTGCCISTTTIAPPIFRLTGTEPRAQSANKTE